MRKFTISRARVVYDRTIIETAEDLLENITDVRRYNDELDLYYSDGRPGMLSKLTDIKCDDVGFDGKTFEDALAHFKANHEKYWEALCNQYS
ncbi:hypothetical protein VPHK567_0247 [Vibrio phage K567]|nr:hypothetical protein MYOV011v1_p0377 [Vibrio phage 6E35.1a]